MTSKRFLNGENMKNQTLSDNACYARLDKPVPYEFNTPNNRMAIEIIGRSDVSHCIIHLYERQGTYWYSVLVQQSRFVRKFLNSVGFVGLQSCVTSLRGIMRDLGFTLYDCEGLTRFVRVWNRQGRKVA